jgi:Na+:H+ antiporter, NhaA family
VQVLLDRRIPASLKVFLTALAVMDDLGAIIVIAVFYTAQFSLAYLLGALAVFAMLVVLNHVFRVMVLFPYLLGAP